MKTRQKPPARKNGQTSRQQRNELVKAFERSGLSGVAFARKHGVPNSTFSLWRRQARSTQCQARFVELEVTAPKPSGPIVVQFGSGVQVHLQCPEQIPLIAQLIGAYQSCQPC